MRNFIHRSSVRLALVGLGAVAGGSGMAFAAGQAIGDGGVISACYRVADDDRKGELRVVSDPGSCRANEAPLRWNVQGPPGPPGYNSFFSGVTMDELAPQEQRNLFAPCPHVAPSTRVVSASALVVVSRTEMYPASTELSFAGTSIRAVNGSDQPASVVTFLTCADEGPGSR